MDALMTRLRELGGERAQWSGHPVWRAMRNLGMAVRHRVDRGDVTADSVHEIAAMIH